MALRHQEFERAAALIRKAIDLGHVSASIYSALGLAQRGAGRCEAAEASLASALQLDDDDFRVWVNLGILYLDQGRIDEASAALESAIQRNPNHADTHLHLAESRLRAKRTAGALESTETALLLDPGSTWGLALQSVALCELGETSRFRELMGYEALVQVIDVNPPPGFDEISRFNRSLARHIQRHRTLRRALPSFSTRGGSQTLGNLLQDRASIIKALEGLIDEVMEQVLDALPCSSSHPQIARWPSRYRLEGWAVRLETRGHQVSHIHRDGWLSGVYYVDLDGVVAADESEGCLELGRAPDALYARGSSPETLLVRPKAGRFVIFPSYLWHRTIPFEREGTRVSFAFDVIPA
jgi:hypothetical protein